MSGTTAAKIKTPNSKSRPKHLTVGDVAVDVTRLVRPKISDDDFFAFCRQNDELRIEMTKEGDVIIMPPTTSETGRKNFNLAVEFGIWAKTDKTGVGFDSSTGFTLPNGAKRSPDVSWIRRERWDALTDAQKNKFAPICPDFVVELRSKTDLLKDLQDKMQEYIENGARLGWLIDAISKKIYVYRPDEAVETLDNPEKISGEPLLKNFELDLKEIW
ncbi:MAG TPA: Uma2 family endonuclease [Pyrinomonadaceae bacterium]